MECADPAAQRRGAPRVEIHISRSAALRSFAFRLGNGVLAHAGRRDGCPEAERRFLRVFTTVSGDDIGGALFIAGAYSLHEFVAGESFALGIIGSVHHLVQAGADEHGHLCGNGWSGGVERMRRNDVSIDYGSPAAEAAGAET